MNKLKPCPFCGSENIDYGRTSCTFGNDINIHCRNCGGKVQICEEYGYEELNNQWNRRIMERYVEQLRWERDVAISQLEELGIGFGEKIEDEVIKAVKEVNKCD